MGVQTDGLLFIQDFNTKEKEILTSEKVENLPNNYQIQVSGKQNEVDYQICLPSRSVDSMIEKLLSGMILLLQASSVKAANA